MAKNNFLLLSLEDDQINNIANAVSNKSAKKILEYLAENKATESQIAKELKLPISTVHYNLQQLTKSGLVSADEFHYSEKGREILHYKLANKYIIIAPQKKRGLKSLFKNILPAVFVTAGITGILSFLNGTPGVMQEEAEPRMMTAEVETTAAQDTAAATEGFWQSLPTDIAIWFFIGAMTAVLIYGVTAYIRKSQ